MKDFMNFKPDMTDVSKTAIQTFNSISDEDPASKTLVTNLAVTMEILRQYHEWLNK